MKKIKSDGSKNKNILVIIMVGLFFLLLALIDTYPLVKYLGSGLPYFPYPGKGYEFGYTVQGDYLQLYYNMWLFKDAILGNIPFFTNPYEFSVGEEYMPYFNPQFLPLSFFFAVFSIFGDIEAYNMLVIFSYVVTGIAGYLLVKLYTKSSVSALLAGIILALFPYRTGELLGGHPNGFLFLCLPLMIYLLERSFKNGSILAASGAGLCVISMAVLESHLHYYSFIFLAFFLPWRFFFPLENSEEISSSSSRNEKIKIGKKGVITVFLAGVAVGISLLLIKSKPPILKDPIFYSSIIIPFVMVAFWILYSRLFSVATAVPFRESLRQDAKTYIPMFLFLLYLTRFIYPIEHLGKAIALTVLVGVAALKFIMIFKVRKTLYSRFLDAWPKLRPRLFKTVIPFVLLCLLTFIWVKLLRILLDASIAAGGRPIFQVIRYSPEIDDILKKNNIDTSKNIYIGIAPFILACLSLFARKISYRRNILFFSGVFIISLILSFGPNLDPYVHLYTVLYNHLPYFNYPRVAGRMITITAIAMAILAGYGIKYLTDAFPSRSARSPRFRYLFIGLVFVVVILNFLPFQVRGISFPSKGNSVYEEIKKDIGDNKVLEIPIWPGEAAWSSVYQYYVTIYRYHMINGYDPGVSKKYVKDIFEKLYPMNFGELTAEEYNFLKKLKVKYIVMHEEEFPRKVSPFPFSSSLDNMKRSPFVSFIKKDRQLYLFKLNKELALVTPVSFKVSSAIGELYQAEGLPRLVGSEAKDTEASGGKAAFAKKGDGEGWLTYGPYRTFPSGSYKAIFRIKINDLSTEQEVAAIDVNAHLAEGILNKKVITTTDFNVKGYKDFILPFSISSPQPLEFRAYYMNKVDIWVDYVYIITADEKDPRFFYKSEDLFNLPDHIGGPTRRYPMGDYTATFYLKSEDNKTFEDMAEIGILTEDGVLAKKGLKNRDFPKVNEYYPFILRFKLDREAFIDFKISSIDMTKIGLEKIEIKKAPAHQSTTHGSTTRRGGEGS